MNSSELFMDSGENIGSGETDNNPHLEEKLKTLTECFASVISATRTVIQGNIYRGAPEEDLCEYAYSKKSRISYLSEQDLDLQGRTLKRQIENTIRKLREASAFRETLEQIKEKLSETFPVLSQE